MDELLYEACPYCSGGQVYNAAQERMEPCSHCRTRGWVITNHICACGRPCTVVSTTKMLYCGEKTCLQLLEADKRAEEWEKSHPKIDYTDSRHNVVRGFHQRDDEDYTGFGMYDFPGYGTRIDA